MSYHISSSNVVSPCKAQPDNCPLGGVHFVTQVEAQIETQRRVLSLGELPAHSEQYPLPTPTITTQALLWASYDLPEASTDQLRAYVKGFNAGVHGNITNSSLALNDEEKYAVIATQAFARVSSLFSRKEEDFPTSSFHSLTTDMPSLKAEILKDEVIGIPVDYPKFRVESKGGVLKTTPIKDEITGLAYRVTEAKYEQHPSTREFRYTLPRVFLQDATGFKYIVEVRPNLFKANQMPLVEIPPTIHRSN